MNSQEDKVVRLFEAAVELATPGERAAYLDALCSEDQQFRAEIEDLLRHDEAAGNFLDSGCQSGPVATRTPSSGRERPGTLIGPYKLLEQIGEGGFGVVYMAEQTQPVRRKVALKVLKPGMDTSQVVARFEAERQALALMNHPNIARVLDAGETHAGRPYFVMELVRGITVTDYCDQNHLTVRERLELFVSICQAVQHAHQKGIIHRDLKPSNILVTLYDGTPVPKIIDFGISKALGQQLTEKTLFTNFVQMMGTPIYMSPEQAEMSGLDIDTRSDIYSLGVLLYELLSGTTPRDKDRLRAAAFDELRRIIREEEPARLSTRITTLGQAAPRVSANRQSDPSRLSQLFRGELDWIVMKALEKDRNRRYDTAIAFAADVLRYLEDEPVLACPPSLLYSFGKFTRRNKTALAVGAVIVVAMLITLFALARTNFLVTKESAQKELALRDKEAAVAAATASAKNATEQLFSALLNQARTGRFSRHMGQRLDSLAALEKAASIRPDSLLRDEAMAALALPDIRRGLSIHAFPPGSKAITFDSLYQTYARINDSGSITVHRIPDNQIIQTIKLPSKVGTIRLSPNGKILVTVDERLSVQLWRIADGQALLGHPLLPCLQVAFSPNSQLLAVALEDWIHIFDLTSGQETNRWRAPARIHALAFHPDNRTLAVGYPSSPVASLYDSSQGSLIADLPIGTINNPVFAWHPDGANLAVTGLDPRIHIWDVTRQRKLVTLEGHVEMVSALSYHPDGNLLASGSWDGVLRLWDTATGRQHMQLPMSATPQFSSNGYFGYMWQGDEHVQLLEVTTSREYRTIVSKLGAGKGHYHDGNISPDGRFLALGMGSAGDRVWDLSSGRELAQLPSGGNSVHFQSDGQALFTMGDGGLLRWSIEQGQHAEVRLGPPHKIALPIFPHRTASNPRSKSLAVISEVDGAGLLLDTATTSVQGQPFKHPTASQVVLSPDEQWIASCGWHSDRVRLWNAKTGNMVHEWVPGIINSVFFTPDSQAIIICRGDAFTFWDLKTLQPIRRLARDVAIYPGHVAFSAGGKLMALEMAPGVIHLKEVATGRTVTKLEDPHGDRAGWMNFTPDGTQLVVAAPYAKAIHVWELRLMRQQLKGIGLDWDWPEFPPPVPTVQTARQAKIEVLAEELAKSQTILEQEARQAIVRYRRDVTTNPDNPNACNHLAWRYLTAPAALRDAKAALPLAENAVRLDPRNADYRNTLGVAYYRAGRYRDAVEMLQSNLDKQDDQGLPLDLYFLAMSHHRLGETARARDYFAWASRWTPGQTELSAQQREELKAFRAEAETLLGIKKEP